MSDNIVARLRKRLRTELAKNTRLREAVESARAAARPTPNGEPLRGRVLAILDAALAEGGETR